VVKIFELIVGYPPFDNLMPKKDDLIREWVSMLGDLPEEWRKYLPPTGANGTYIRSPLLRLFCNRVTVHLFE